MADTSSSASSTAATPRVVTRSPVTVQPDASVTAEAGERWRLRHQRAAPPADWDATSNAVQQGAGERQGQLHPAWRAWIGGVAVGGCCSAAAYSMLQRYGFYAKQGKHRPDRVTILVLAFSLPFFAVVNFSKASERTAQRNTLHAR